MTVPDRLAAAAADGAAFNRACIEAARRSNRLWIAGLQDLGQRRFGIARGMGERLRATARALSSARSVRETLEIHAAHLSTEVKQSVKQTADLQHAVLHLMQQASAPLMGHLTASSTAVAARNFQS